MYLLHLEYWVNSRNTALSKYVCVSQEGYSPGSSWWSYLCYRRFGWQLLLQRCRALWHRKRLLERRGSNEHTQRRSGVCGTGGKTVEEELWLVHDIYSGLHSSPSPLLARVSCTQWEATMVWRRCPAWSGLTHTSTSGQRSARWASDGLEMESANSMAASM